MLIPSLVACMSPFEPGVLVRPTVDEDPSLPALDLLDTRLHVREFGDPANPVMIVLHGGPGSGDSRYMESLLAPLPDGYRLEDDFYMVYWDQRGTGLSRRHDDRDLLTWAQYRRDLEALVDLYSPEDPVVLVGHSGGGTYATNYINANPDRVSAAVLIEPGPLSGENAQFSDQESIQVNLLEERFSDWFFAHDAMGSPNHEAADFHFMIAAFEPQEFRGDTGDFNPLFRLGALVTIVLAFPFPEYDFTTDLDAFDTKVLFIGTDQSSDVGTAFQREQAKDFPNAEVVGLTGVGHATMMAEQNIELVLQPIRTYLAELGLVEAP